MQHCEFAFWIPLPTKKGQYRTRIDRLARVLTQGHACKGARRGVATASMATDRPCALVHGWVDHILHTPPGVRSREHPTVSKSIRGPPPITHFSHDRWGCARSIITFSPSVGCPIGRFIALFQYLYRLSCNWWAAFIVVSLIFPTFVVCGRPTALIIHMSGNPIVLNKDFYVAPRSHFTLRSPFHRHFRPFSRYSWCAGAPRH